MCAAEADEDYVWDLHTRADPGALFSKTAADAASDTRLGEIHLKILIILGRYTGKGGWVRISQERLGKLIGFKLRAVTRAMEELVTWGRVEIKRQAQTHDSLCHYRAVIDEPEWGCAPLCAPPRGGVRTGTRRRAHGSDAQVRTTVRTSGAPHIENARVVGHIDHIEHESDEAKLLDRTDAVGLRRLPFTADVIRDLGSMGVDVDQLIKDYVFKTRGKGIRDPSAYLLRMGRELVARQTGVTVDQIKNASSRSRTERAAAFATMSATPNVPSESCVMRARRQRGDDLVDDVLRRMSGRTFPATEAADAAFWQEIANAALRRRSPGRPA